MQVSKAFIDLDTLNQFEETREIPEDYISLFNRLSKLSASSFYTDHPKDCLKLISVLDNLSSEYPELQEINLRIIKICQEKRIFVREKSANEISIQTRNGTVKINRVAYKTFNEWCAKQVNFEEGKQKFAMRHYSKKTIKLLRSCIYVPSKDFSHESFENLFDLMELAKIMTDIELQERVYKMIGTKTRRNFSKKKVVSFLRTLMSSADKIDHLKSLTLILYTFKKNQSEKWLWDVFEALMETPYFRELFEHSSDESFSKLSYRFAQIISQNTLDAARLILLHELVTKLLPISDSQKDEIMQDAISSLYTTSEFFLDGVGETLSLAAEHLKVITDENEEIFRKWTPAIHVRPENEDDKRQLSDIMVMQQDKLDLFRCISIPIETFSLEEIDLLLEIFYEKSVVIDISQDCKKINSNRQRFEISSIRKNLKKYAHFFEAHENIHLSINPVRKSWYIVRHTCEEDDLHIIGKILKHNPHITNFRIRKSIDGDKSKTIIDIIGQYRKELESKTVIIYGNHYLEFITR